MTALLRLLNRVMNKYTKAVLAVVALSVFALPVRAETDPCSRAYAISAAIMTARQHEIPLPQVLETTNALVNALSENQRAGVETTLRSIIVRAYRKNKTDAELISADEFGNSYGLECLTGEDRRFPAINWDQQTRDAFGEWAEVLLTADKRRKKTIQEAFKDAVAEIRSLEEFAQKKHEAELTLLNALASEKAAANVLDAITTRITRAWRRPVAFQSGLEVYLRISLASNGELVDVRIVKTSGDVLFDRSALTAVQRAAPFDEVKQFDATTFEERFRSLTVKFRPDG